MPSEPVAMQQALELVFERLYSVFEGASFRRRSDLVVVLLPSVPFPQCSGAWVCDDSDAAVEALADAVAEVEAAGERPWVQTRLGHERTRQAALELGLTHAERLPGMVVRPEGFVEARPDLEIGLIASDEIDETNGILAASFGAPIALFDRFTQAVQQVDEARWYVGRNEGAVVSTALAFRLDGSTGIFNVATGAEHRGRGYGAALTSRALRDGFAAGSRFGYLQSSTVGHGVYRRVGFRDVDEYTLLTRPLPS